MQRPPRRPLRDPLEARIEDAFAFGEFIPWIVVDGFVDRLRDCTTEIDALVASDPARAASLFELLLAGCYEKVEELDDDHFATEFFVVELFCSWVVARQAAGAPPGDIAAWLIARMSNDRWSFTWKLDESVVKVMTPATCDAFTHLVRLHRNADSSDGLRHRGSRREWSDVLRTIHAHRGDANAYAALCAETETTVDDCVALATMLRSRAPVDAIAWVARGLELAGADTTSYAPSRLATLKRELLAEMGHGGEALDDAWRAFAAQPSACAYQQLVRFAPEAERPAWRTRALDAAASVPLERAMDLLLEADAPDRLAARVTATSDLELEAIGHYRNGRVAERLDEPHPAIAARVYRALGMRVANSGKSKYYDAAIQNFADARRCYEAAGLGVDWAQVVAEVRREHGRKWRLLSGFEHVVSHGRPCKPPSLLDRARARWAT